MRDGAIEVVIPDLLVLFLVFFCLFSSRIFFSEAFRCHEGHIRREHGLPLPYLSLLRYGRKGELEIANDPRFDSRRSNSLQKSLQVEWSCPCRLFVFGWSLCFMVICVWLELMLDGDLCLVGAYAWMIHGFFFLFFFFSLF